MSFYPGYHHLLPLCPDFAAAAVAAAAAKGEKVEQHQTPFFGKECMHASNTMID